MRHKNDTNLIEELFRKVPNFKGKRRIGRYLFHREIKEDRAFIVKGKAGCAYKLPNLLESIAFDIFVNGIYEEDTYKFLLKTIPKNGVFLDLGANIGSISIPLCKTRADIRCVAVEAAPWIFDYLIYNIRINQLADRIICINNAITDKDGENLPFYSPEDQFGKGSLSPVFTNKAVLVETLTVDKMVEEMNLQSVSMIKIDIEGFEFFAFNGSLNLLQSKSAPDILFEYVDWAEERAGLAKGSAQELLRSLGYKIYLIDSACRLTPLHKTLIDESQLLFASKRIQ